jgi:hypothetical protein
MRYIGALFTGATFSLLMIGCLADNETSIPTEEHVDNELGAAPNTAELGSGSDTQPALAEMSPQTGSMVPEPAGTGVTCVVTDCGDDAWNSPSSGTPHASIAGCSITWCRDVSVSPIEYWQDEKFELYDAMTDGVCAWATVTGISGHYYECEGIWTWKYPQLSGRRPSITTTVSWGGNQPVSRTRYAPTGF